MGFVCQHSERTRQTECSLCVTQEVETIVKASVLTADSGGQIHMVLGITQETPEMRARTLSQECAVSVGGGEVEPV